MKIAFQIFLFSSLICIVSCKEAPTTISPKEEMTMPKVEKAEEVQSEIKVEDSNESVNQGLPSDKNTGQNPSAKGSKELKQTQESNTPKKVEEDMRKQVDQFVKSQPIITAGEVVEVDVVEGNTKRRIRGTKVKLTPMGVKGKPKNYIKPIMTFKNPVFDFGEIDEGDIIDHVFVFTNTGKTDLQIKDANPSCGCTYPSIPFVPIKPGEQGKIAIQYNSVGKSGPQNATITINSNASVPAFDLILKGNVIGDGKEEVLTDLRDLVKKNPVKDSVKVDSSGSGK